jgi:creatinine amidohydrolase
MLNHMFSMNREQFKALMEKTDLAFLPVSPMEAHGPHLPLGSDVLTACQMCDDAARKLQDEGIESLIAAPINYCLADVASCFPGTATIRAETVTALVEDVCTNLAGRGFKKILFVSGHAEPANMEAIIQGGENVRKKYPDFKYFFSEWFTKGLPLTYHVLREEHPEWDIHAGEIESSQIMYIRPEWVNEEAMRALKVNNEAEFFGERLAAGVDNFIDLGAPDTYFGDPAKATAETGRKIFDIVSDFIVKEVKEYLL